MDIRDHSKSRCSSQVPECTEVNSKVKQEVSVKNYTNTVFEQ